MLQTTFSEAKSIEGGCGVEINCYRIMVKRTLISTLNLLNESGN